MRHLAALVSIHLLLLLPALYPQGQIAPSRVIIKNSSTSTDHLLLRDASAADLLHAGVSASGASTASVGRLYTSDSSNILIDLTASDLITETGPLVKLQRPDANSVLELGSALGSSQYGLITAYGESATAQAILSGHGSLTINDSTPNAATLLDLSSLTLYDPGVGSRVVLDIESSKGALNLTTATAETTTIVGGTVNISDAAGETTNINGGVITSQAVRFEDAGDHNLFFTFLEPVSGVSGGTIARLPIASPPGDGYGFITTNTTGISTELGWSKLLSLPFYDDSGAFICDDANPTRCFRFYANGLTTTGSRVIAVQDADLTMAGIDVAQTFSAAQTFSSTVDINSTLTVDANADFLAGNQVDFEDVARVLSLQPLNASAVIGSAFFRFAAAHVGSLSLYDTGSSSSITLGYPFSTNTYTVDFPGAGPGGGSSWASGMVLQTSATTGLLEWASVGGLGLPVVDTTALAYDDGDATKQVALEVSGLTTATTRVLAVQDADYTIAGTQIDNGFTGTQTFQTIQVDTDSAYDLAANAARIRFAFADVWNAEKLEIENLAHTNAFNITRSDPYLILDINDTGGNPMLRFDVESPNNRIVAYKAVQPGADVAYDLGDSGKRWNHGWFRYLGDSGTLVSAIYSDASNINTATINTDIEPDVDEGATSGTATKQWVAVYATTLIGGRDSAITGALQLYNASTTGTATITTGSLAGGVNLVPAVSIYPQADNTLYMGIPSRRWGYVYATTGYFSGINVSGIIGGGAVFSQNIYPDTDVTYEVGSTATGDLWASMAAQNYYAGRNNSRAGAMTFYNNSVAGSAVLAGASTGGSVGIQFTGDGLYPDDDGATPLGLTSRGWEVYASTLHLSNDSVTVSGSVGSPIGACSSGDLELSTAAAGGHTGHPWFCQDAAWLDLTASAPPFTDSNSIIQGSADTSKLLKFEIDGFTPSTTRTLTPQNASYTIAGTNINNTFTGAQAFNDLNVTGVYEMDGATLINASKVVANIRGMQVMNSTAAAIVTAAPDDTGAQLFIYNPSGAQRIAMGHFSSGAQASIGLQNTTSQTIGLSTGGTIGLGLYVNSTKVVGQQQSAISDPSGTADATYDSSEATLINDTATAVANILAAMRAHGLIAP